MSLEFNGVASSMVYKSSGLVSSTSSFSILFAIKTLSITGAVSSPLTLANYTGTPTGHVVATNTGGSVFGVYPNYLGMSASPGSLLVDNQWHFIHLSGTSSTALTLSYMPSGATSVGNIVKVSATQTTFVPTFLSLGDSGGGEPSNVRIAQFRAWSGVALSDAQVLAEINSARAVLTSGLVDEHTMTGASLSAALTGESGGSFTLSGGVSLSNDDPTAGISVVVGGQFWFRPGISQTTTSPSAGVISCTGSVSSVEGNSTVTITLLKNGVVQEVYGPVNALPNFSKSFTGLANNNYVVRYEAADNWYTAATIEAPIVLSSTGSVYSNTVTETLTSNATVQETVSGYTVGNFFAFFE